MRMGSSVGDNFVLQVAESKSSTFFAPSFFEFKMMASCLSYFLLALICVVVPAAQADANGGSTCAGCTIIIGIVGQLTEVHNEVYPFFIYFICIFFFSASIVRLLSFFSLFLSFSLLLTTHDDRIVNILNDEAT